MAEDLPNIFAHSPLDRATHRRSQTDWLHQVESDAFILPFWRGQVFTLASQAIGFVRSGLLRPEPSIGAIFLGVDKNDKAYFACPLSDSSQPEEAALSGLGSFADLRALAAQAPAGDLAIAAQGRALVEWHRNHMFCARCGSQTQPKEAGHKRYCEACRLEHFPRTDPVVIMMIHYQDKGFLGRQKSWPQGFFSALAGFIEPGETIEEAVIRESFEEAQITIKHVRYHATQPWPWPYSLMIGCLAEAESDQFAVDGVELENGRWFARDQLRDMLKGKSVEDVRLPPPMAIAYRLIHAFAFLD